MKRSVILIAAAAFLCAGCEKIIDKEGAAKKLAVAEEAAAAAQAQVKAMTTAKELGVSSTEEERKAAQALAVILCSSPALLEDIENDAYLMEALSGAGSDKNEAKRQFLELQRKYRAILERHLPAHGSSYAEFSRYAAKAMPGKTTAARIKEFKDILVDKCPQTSGARLEKAAGSLMFHCAAAGPK